MHKVARDSSSDSKLARRYVMGELHGQELANFEKRLAEAARLLELVELYKYLGNSMPKEKMLGLMKILDNVLKERSSVRSFVHAFICHASDDKPLVRRLSRKLEDLGSEVWFDEWEIVGGDSIVTRIDDAYANITHLIVVLSEASVKSPWVRKEWSVALMRQLSMKPIRIVPVRIDDCKMPNILCDIKYVDARNGLTNRMLLELKAALGLH